MLKPRPVWIVVVLAVLAGGVYMQQKKAADSAALTKNAASAATNPATNTAIAGQAPASMELLASDIYTVKTATVQNNLNVSGALRALNQAMVKARVAGEVREILVREGESVQAGQILLKMDSTDYESKIAQAKGVLAAAQGQLEIARQTRDNNKSLLDKNFISKNASDNSQSQYAIALANADAAKAALALAQKALSDTVIVAPISGLVSSRSVQAGEKVSPDNKLFEVLDLRVLEMEAPVPAQEIGKIKIDQAVQISIEGVAERFKGVINRINPATAPGSRSIMAYIQIANPQGDLRAGMFAQAQLVMQQKNDVISIPQTALRYENGQAFVYAITAQGLQQKFVKLGLSGDIVQNGESLPGAEVVSGLSASEQIIKTNLGTLRLAVPVKVIGVNKPSAAPVTAPAAAPVAVPVAAPVKG